LFLHCKKRFAIFPSPAGMSLTKLSLAGNNLIKISLENDCTTQFWNLLTIANSWNQLYCVSLSYEARYVVSFFSIKTINRKTVHVEFGLWHPGCGWENRQSFLQCGYLAFIPFVVLKIPIPGRSLFHFCSTVWIISVFLISCNCPVLLSPIAAALFLFLVHLTNLLKTDLWIYEHAFVLLLFFYEHISN
jgi:hypothetical protein